MNTEEWTKFGGKETQLVVVDRCIHAGAAQNASSCKQVRLVVERFDPEQVQVGPCKALKFEAHESHVVDENEVPGDEGGELGEATEGLGVDDESKFDAHSHTLQIQESSHCLVQRSPRLNHVVVLFGQVRVEGNTKDEVGVLEASQASGEIRVREPSSVRKDVYPRSWQLVPYRRDEFDTARPE